VESGKVLGQLSVAANQLVYDFPISHEFSWLTQPRDKETDITWLYGPTLSPLAVLAAAPVSQSSQENPSMPRKSALKRTASKWLRYPISKDEHQRLRVGIPPKRPIVFSSQVRLLTRPISHTFLTWVRSSTTRPSRSSVMSILMRSLSNVFSWSQE
jgi:hypothetical protein